MAKKLRFGIFGAGRGRAFPYGILYNGGEVVAVCEQNTNCYESFLEHCEHKIAPTHYENFDEFIEHDMDAVILCNCFHEHVPYAIRCLEKGIHVLSECTSNSTMAEGVALVRAAEKSNATYMLAENYPFMCYVQELRRVYNSGTLGKFLYGEGEYNHPAEHGFADSPEHWRTYIPATYYITHSLAPLMYTTGAWPTRITAMPVYAPFNESDWVTYRSSDRAAVITCLNNDDSVYRVFGCSQFAGEANAYRFSGTKGKIENLRGTDGMINLHYNEWQTPEGQQSKQTYMATWPEEIKEIATRGGHEGGDLFVINEFYDCVVNSKKPKLDVYFATTCASVAILGHRSLLERGVPYDIPDFRKEEDRVKYENDDLTPFPRNGQAPTLPCCSHWEEGPQKAFVAYEEKWRKAHPENK